MLFVSHTGIYVNKVTHSSSMNMDYFHFHKKYELYFLQKGSRHYFVNDKVYVVGQGNTVILGLDDIHKTRSIDGAAHTRYVINFSRECLEPLARAFPLVNPFAVFDHMVNVLSTPLKETHLIEKLFHAIWELQQHDMDEKGIALQNTYLYQLLLLLDICVQIQIKEGSALGQVTHPVIDKVVSYIGQHYKQELTLDSIAAEVFITPTYLSRLFKKITNLSIVEYINVVRVREARELLENTNMQISEISEAVGYTTTTHFSRMFKRGTDLSPYQYHKKYGDESHKR